MRNLGEMFTINGISLGWTVGQVKNLLGEPDDSSPQQTDFEYYGGEYAMAMREVFRGYAPVGPEERFLSVDVSKGLVWRVYGGVLCHRGLPILRAGEPSSALDVLVGKTEGAAKRPPLREEIIRAGDLCLTVAIARETICRVGMQTWSGWEETLKMQPRKKSGSRDLTRRAVTALAYSGWFSRDEICRALRISSSTYYRCLRPSD